MNIPERPPTDLNLLNPRENIEKMLSLSNNEDFLKIINDANNQYLFWDKFKYLKFPKDINPVLAWSYLKSFSRKIDFEPLALKDQNNNKFGFWLPEGIQRDLHLIDKFAWEKVFFNESLISPETKDKYLISSLMEEAIASSLLEGAATTRKQAKEMLRSGKKPKTYGEKMVFNNFMTIKKLAEFREEPLSLELLNEIHGLITAGTLKEPEMSGRIRKDDETRVVDNEGNILHVPPPARDLPERLKLMFDFANRKEQDPFIHPVIKAVILHFWLAYEHPYIDGNGRVARALFYWAMLKSDYWIFEFLSVSRIILKSPGQYARAFLYTEMDGRDMTYFIHYHIKAIRLAIEEFRLYLFKKQNEFKTLSAVLDKNHPELNFRQSTLMQNALRNPDKLFSIQTHQNITGVVYETARRDLLELQKINLMTKIKKGHKFYFVLNKEASNLLQDKP